MKGQFVLITSLLWGVTAFAESTTPVALPDSALTTLTTTTTTTTVTEDAQSPMRELCNTYAKEDNVAAADKESYITKCLAGMTDLNESVTEALPVESDDPNDAVPPNLGQTAPASTNTPESSEGLVKDEIVEKPDPAAEQLDIKLN